MRLAGHVDEGNRGRDGLVARRREKHGRLLSAAAPEEAVAPRRAPGRRGCRKSGACDHRGAGWPQPPRPRRPRGEWGQSTVSYLWAWADEEYGLPPAPPSVEDRWAKAVLRKRRFVDLEPWLIVPLGATACHGRQQRRPSRSSSLRMTGCSPRY